jgi:hypothetical protein
MTGSSQVQDGPDLVGKLVRWECQGQWLTARVDGAGMRDATWRGTVVDPGNYHGLSDFAPKQALYVGDTVPNLRAALLTVVDEATPSMGAPRRARRTVCGDELLG